MGPGQFLLKSMIFYFQQLSTNFSCIIHQPVLATAVPKLHGGAVEVFANLCFLTFQPN
jgi:hypothetical protein